MRTLVGADEPDPPAAFGPFVSATSTHAGGANAVTSTGTSATFVFHAAPLVLEVLREPYRTTAYVGRRREIEGPAG